MAMPTEDGFCGGQCRPNSICHVDIYMGVEECLCDAGHYLRAPENFGEVETCEECRFHSYKGEIGNFPCRPCPNPMFSNNTGSLSIDECVCPIDVISDGNEDTQCTGKL